MKRDLLSILETNLEQLQIYPNSGMYLLGLSGGPDSMFLLYALTKLNYKNIKPVYINYHDSDFVFKEENIVKTAVNQCNTPLLKYDVEAKQFNTNFEKAAREYRYNLFGQIQKDLNYNGILIAHQEDDLIITYLMQKQKNGLITYYGLKSKNIVSNATIFRPMLNITKEEIINYLNENNIVFYDDITNKNQSRLRNYLRENKLHLIDRKQILKEINEENSAISNKLAFADNKILNLKKYNSLDDDKLKQAAIYKYIKSNYNQLDEKTIIACKNLIFYKLKNKATSSIQLTNSLSFYQDYNFAYIANTIHFYQYEYKLNNVAKYSFKEFSIDLSTFNIKQTNYPLTIKNICKNSTISTNIITKDIDTFLKKQKVPLYLRPFYPMILNKDNKIIYVPFYKDILNKSIDFKFNDFLLPDQI